MFDSLILTTEGKRFLKTLEDLGKKAVYVGFVQGKYGNYEDGTTVAQVAAWNEFGTRNMPARPFMMQTVTTRQAEIKKLFQEAGKQVLKGADAEKVYNQIGVVGKAMMQEQIVNGDFAPNAASTIRMKGSDKPLIDTGQMRQSVNYVIR